MLEAIFLLLTVIFGTINVNNNVYFNFFSITVLLAVYFAIKLYRLYKQTERNFFIHPMFLTSLVTFGLALGVVTNFFLIKNGVFAIKSINEPLVVEPEWLKKAMILVAFAAAATWVGFSLNTGEKLYNKYMNYGISKRLYSGIIGSKRLLIFCLFAYAIKFYLYNVGLYGRIVDEKFFEAGTGYKAGSQLRVLSDLSYLTFFLISYYMFKHRTRFYVGLFVFSFALELFFGFIYGARSTFITPFLIIFLAYYYVTNRIRIAYLVVLMGALYIAFTAVLDYKNFTLTKEFSRGERALDALSNFNSYQQRYVNVASGYTVEETIESTMNSFSFIQEASMAVRQKDKVGMKDLSNPDMIVATLKFPYDAFIPRFIQGRNEFPWGMWFKDEVLNFQVGLKYSIGMSPVGFLYMGGGWIFVIVGFFIFGIVVKLNACFLRHNNIYALLTFISLLSVTYNLDSVYYTLLINTLRYLFIYPLIFYVLFDPTAFRKKL